MSARRGPTPRQARRRRGVALGLFALALGLVPYLILTATVFAPVDRHGARLAHLQVNSRAVG